MSKLNELLVEKFCTKPIYLKMGAGKLSRRWKCTEEEVREARVRAKELLNSESVAEATLYIQELEDQLVKISNEKGTLESTVTSDFAPQSDEELAQLHKIDLTRYKISSYWSKLKSDGKFTSSVYAALRKPSEFDPEAFQTFLENYTPKDFEINVYVDEEQPRKTVDVEISIADFHLNRETLAKDSIVDRPKEFMQVLTNLINSVSKVYDINTIAFPIGNDFFNSDNYQGTTTNGTPQDNSVRWDNAYEVGYDLLVKAIFTLKAQCNNLQVILVQGNHDRTTSYYLAHALAVYFKEYGDISFDRGNTTTKHVVLGKTFIGYHHGNTKLDELPLMFATSPDSSVQFGLCKFREVHTADKHHYMVKEIKGSGVRVQQIPSLVNPDRWSTDNNYVNTIRAGLALIYDQDNGKIGELEERI